MKRFIAVVFGVSAQVALAATTTDVETHFELVSGLKVFGVERYYSQAVKDVFDAEAYVVRQQMRKDSNMYTPIVALAVGGDETTYLDLGEVELTTLVAPTFQLTKENVAVLSEALTTLKCRMQPQVSMRGRNCVEYFIQTDETHWQLATESWQGYVIETDTAGRILDMEYQHLDRRLFRDWLIF